MKSAKSLIQELNTKDQGKIFNALVIIDNNTQELLNRIKALEIRNMMYYVVVTHSVNQNIATGAALVFNTTIYPQFGNMHDNTNNNDKVFIRRDGVYHINAGAVLGANAGGTFRTLAIALTRNGATINIAGSETLVANINLGLNAGISYYCYVGDYIQVSLIHDIPGNLVVLTNAMTFLSVTERMEDLYPIDYGNFDPEINTR
jgi:hypothetical protein